MPYQKIGLCYKNILETSTITLSVGTEDPDFPLNRIYDRDISNVFKGSDAADTTEIKIDQGGNTLPVDRLLIIEHNLSGITLNIKWSENDADYYAAVPQWVQGDNNLITKSWAALTKRYWKFYITPPSLAPQIGELFLSSFYEFEINPGFPASPLEDEFNVKNLMSAGGQDRFAIFGGQKKQRPYSIAAGTNAQMANIILFNNAWKGSKPFFLQDHEGTWIFGKLKKPLDLKINSDEEIGFDFDFLEVIP